MASGPAPGQQLLYGSLPAEHEGGKRAADLRAAFGEALAALEPAGESRMLAQSAVEGESVQLGKGHEQSRAALPGMLAGTMFPPITSLPAQRESGEPALSAVSHPGGIEAQLRAFFVQALERMLPQLSPPTVAHLRLEVPQWGQLLLIVSVHGEEVFVHAETPSPELGRQLVAAVEGLQNTLSERQLRLGGVSISPSGLMASWEFSHSFRQRGEEAAYRERAQFVQSFRWHRSKGVTV